MAALLVALAVMAVLMSVALPVWRHDAQREKEEELVFRGQQYVRAVRLFQARNRTFPTSIDMLVQGRYLRKKFKDPVTNEDFNPIPAAGAIPGQGGQTAGGRSGPQPGQTGVPGSSMGSSTGSSSTSNPFSGSSAIIPGGMIGVVSKSKDESIRLYQGRNHYNEWTFIYVNQQPGGPGGPGGQGRPGGPGGRGRGAVDGRGNPIGGFPPMGGTTIGGSPFGGPGGAGGPGGTRTVPGRGVGAPGQPGGAPGQPPVGFPGVPGRGGRGGGS